MCLLPTVVVPVHDAAAVAELQRSHHLEQVGLPIWEFDQRRGERGGERERENEPDAADTRRDKMAGRENKALGYIWLL